MLKHVLSFALLFSLTACTAPDTPEVPNTPDTPDQEVSNSDSSDSVSGDEFLTKTRYRTVMTCAASKLPPAQQEALLEIINDAVSVSDDVWAQTGGRNLGALAQVKDEESKGC